MKERPTRWFLEPRNGTRHWAEGIIWRDQALASGNKDFAARADALFAEAIATDPNEIGFYMERARLHRNHPELLERPASPEQIVQWTAETVKLRPYSMRARVDHARSLAHAGRRDEARRLGYALLDRYPVIGLAVWAAIFAAAALRAPDLGVAAQSLKGTLFLLSLVTCASLMPVETLPPASWATALGLGFVSAVFDNIPLTALALRQGGYDWGVLAYAVGFGGSMLWFGSSAGVAICGLYPEARSTGSWLREGWPISVAYVAGFAALLFTLGWRPAS